jgi:hypothetical protein
VERIRGPDAGEQLSMALDWLPKSVARRLGFVHYFIGDPVFAGLHEFEIADDGGSYRTSSQYVSESCQTHRPRSARRATIVLPHGPGRTATVIHELGHALDEVLGYEWLAKPVSKYARVDPFEAFAEGFTAWWDSPATRPSATGSIGLTVTQPRSSMPSPCRCSSAMGDLT